MRADASGYLGLARQRIRFDNSAPIVDLNGADPGTSNAIAYAEGESLTLIAPVAPSPTRTRPISTAAR